MSWNAKYIIIIAAITLVSYICAIYIGKADA